MPSVTPRPGLVGRNAAALAVMPGTKPPAERRSFTPEARAIPQAAKGEHLEAMVVVGMPPASVRAS